MTNEEIRHQHEAKVLIEHYQKMITPGSDENRFRACFYNKINKFPAEQKKFLAENVPLTVSGEPVDLAKWLKAVEKNPSKNTLGVTQTNSVAGLKERAEAILVGIKKTRERLEKLTD